MDIIKIIFEKNLTILFRGEGMFQIFEICFWTGTLFTVIGFLFGQIFDFLGLDGGMDFHGDFLGFIILPLKPVTLAAFVTVFGGTGMILTHKGVGVLAATILSLGAGLVIALLIFRLIIVPLQKAQSTSAISQSELIGRTAIVKTAIKGRDFGRITYTAASNSYSAPARSIDETDVEKNSEVLIVKIDKNVFYVIKK
jgi:membrane protein implicated in regulation of membrane protease activity